MPNEINMKYPGKDKNGQSYTRHDEDGHEILDERPIQPPLGYKRAPSLSEQIRQQVLAAKLEALEALEETDEEADDFEVGDDFEPTSPHENDGIPTIKELKERALQINREIQRQNTERIKKQLEERHEHLRARNQSAGGSSSPPAPTEPPSTP